MPGGIEITTNQESKRYYFPVPHTALPILKKDGALVFLPWGRRNEEDGLLPPGGWARLSSIKEGTWARFHPQPVKIPATGWMEKDSEGNSHYFPLKDNECIQGLVAKKGTEERLYLVTVEATETKSIHPRAPRIITQIKAKALCRAKTLVFSKKPEMVSDSETELARPPAPTKDDLPSTHTALKENTRTVPAWLARFSKRQQALWECLSTLGSISHDAILAEQHLRTLRQGNDE